MAAGPLLDPSFVRLSLAQRLTLSAQTALLLSVSYNRDFEPDRADSSVSWQWYFD
jgi:hypothetical protein